MTAAGQVFEWVWVEADGLRRARYASRGDSADRTVYGAVRVLEASGGWYWSEVGGNFNGPEPTRENAQAAAESSLLDWEKTVAAVIDGANRRAGEDARG